VNEIGCPAMSVVIATPDHYKTIRKTVGYLRAQTVREQLEVVIVAPTSADTLAISDTELCDFFQFRVVEVDEVRSIAQANAAGIRQASAPVVAFVEEHSYPDPGWAEALLDAHRQHWAAVGPVVRNANPASLVSWADFLIAYGLWMDPSPAGEVDLLPGHNSSYKHTILLDYGPELEAMLESESVLHWDLQAKGYQLYLESAAKISHLNFELLSSWILAQFLSGRLFAATRARYWSLLQRLFYTGGAPLIPVIRFRRIFQQLRRSGQRRNLPPGVLPMLVLGLVASGTGEMMGYAMGAGDAKRRLSSFEFHRYRHVKGQDEQVVPEY
jgi:glycosyltransferase involved in cell wall biosynthesis